MKTLREELYDNLPLMKCQGCGEVKPDVSCRPNAYANDVGNDPDAMHTVCDECDYHNRMDI